MSHFHRGENAWAICSPRFEHKCTENVHQAMGRTKVAYIRCITLHNVTVNSLPALRYNQGDCHLKYRIVQMGRNPLNITSQDQQGKMGGSEPNPFRHTSHEFLPFCRNRRMWHPMRRRGQFVRALIAYQEKKKRRGFDSEGRESRRLPVSFERELRDSGGTHTLEAMISLKQSYIKAHGLSQSFLISL